MAQPTTILSLPKELLDVAFKYLDTSDLVHLRKAHRLFKHSAIRVLYRDIQLPLRFDLDLSGSKRIHNLHRTMLGEPEMLTFVRHLHLDYIARAIETRRHRSDTVQWTDHPLLHLGKVSWIKDKVLRDLISISHRLESIALKFTDYIYDATPSQEFCRLLQSMIQGRVISFHVICNTPYDFPFSAFDMLGKVDSIVIDEPIRRDPAAHASHHKFPNDAYILAQVLEHARFETPALCLGCAIVTDILDLNNLVNTFHKLTSLRMWVGYNLSASEIAQALLPLKNTLEVLDIQRERICNPKNLSSTAPASFAEFTALRTLRVHSNTWIDQYSCAQGRSTTSPKDFIWNLEDDNRSVISQYLPPNLEELEMTLHYPHMLFARGKPHHMKFNHLPASEREKGFEWIENLAEHGALKRVSLTESEHGCSGSCSFNLCDVKERDRVLAPQKVEIPQALRERLRAGGVEVEVRALDYRKLSVRYG